MQSPEYRNNKQLCFGLMINEASDDAWHVSLRFEITSRRFTNDLYRTSDPRV